MNKTTGAWGAYGYSGWIELSFTPGTLIGSMVAVFDMSPAGHVTNILTVDGHALQTWSQAMVSGFTMTYNASSSPVAATKLRMTTTQDPSWVAYGAITVETCS